MVSEVFFSLVRRSLEMPKSVTFTEPLVPRRTFAGLMSRWMMPSWWTAESASQTLMAMRTAVRWLRVNSFWSFCWISSPLMYSRTR